MGSQIGRVFKSTVGQGTACSFALKRTATSPFCSEFWKLSTGRGAIAIHGGAWSILGYVSTQLLRTLATLTLARHFLGPEAFGIVGLVGVFLTGLGMFSELGILANIVQHPRGDDPQFLNTAYSIQATRGFFIWMFSIALAYPVSVIYKEPQLLPLLAVAGLSEMVRGLTSTVACTLTRHINLRRITLLTIVSEVLAFALAVMWAAVSPSAWVLVARTIASAAIYAIGSHFIVERRVHFGWDRSAVKEILHFGGWVSLGTATHFLGNQGERLILGKLVSPAELGCFSLAVMISSVPAAGLNLLVNQIFLPMISKATRTSRQLALEDFRRARRAFFGLAVFTGTGFLTCAKSFVSLLLPPKYVMAGWMLQALGVRVALDIFAAPASSIILAYGRSKYSAGANMTRLIVMISGVWVVFTLFGIRQAVASLIVAQIISYVPLIVGLRRLLPEVARSEVRWYALLLLFLGFAAQQTWSSL
jgi:O-antigen/teichoic acid export membrane protein